MDVLLVIDAGNSNVTFGAFADEQLVKTYRVRTDTYMTADEIALQCRLHLGPDLRITGAIISCVVPLFLSTLVRGVELAYQVEALIVGPGIRTGIPIRYEDPRELGSDRIANAVGAVHRFGPPVIIVDLGTATTISVIDEKGQYLGGAIAPGVKTAAEGLFQRASRLPQVDLVWPKDLVQRNTVLSMQAGIMFGAALQIDGMVSRIQSEYKLPFRVVLTGGLSKLFEGRLHSECTIEPHLTLLGLRLLWARNTTGRH